MTHARVFPFSAIVGQETLKTALLVNAVDPRVGGVLVRGEKGTAKSTAVRALAAVLPDIDVVSDCRFSCDPGDPGSWCPECRERRDEGRLPRAARPVRVVELPVSATEDRLVGTLDFEHAIKMGERRFESGLLALANRGILYVDEVNLLDDHLVDSLLDAAAMGVNTVEREGVAFAHPARFILVGTMNPEEGELRPQLIDRFGLSVTVAGLSDPLDRVEVMRRRTSYEDDPDGFRRAWRDADDELRRAVTHARGRLRSLEVPHDLLVLIATICAEVGVDGHRADIVMTRASAALAALEGRTEVTAEDVRRSAPLVLAHRARRTPLGESQAETTRMESVLAAAQARSQPAGTTEPSQPAGESEGLHALRCAIEGRVAEPVLERAGPEISSVMRLDIDHVRRSASGRRQDTVSDDRRGRTVSTEPLRPGAEPDVAVAATIRQAAPHQLGRERTEDGPAVRIEPSDVRNRVRRRRVGASILFCVDASGSMGASARMEATKAAVLDLLVDAYQRRDRVGLVSFRGDAAELLLSPTASVDLAERRLRAMPTGGATPLAHGLRRSREVLELETRRDETIVPWLVLLTDGRANVPLDGPLASEDAKREAARVREAGIHMVVVDTAGTAATAARELAAAAAGEYVRLARVDGTSLTGTVRQRLQAV